MKFLNLKKKQKKQKQERNEKEIFRREGSEKLANSLEKRKKEKLFVFSTIGIFQNVK